MKRKLGKKGLDLIKSFESFVPYVYDDLLPPVRGKYREWNGGAVKGTLTIGYGHTDAAKHPLKIEHGLKISQAKALEVLDVDLDECARRRSTGWSRFRSRKASSTRWCHSPSTAAPAIFRNHPCCASSTPRTMTAPALASISTPAPRGRSCGALLAGATPSAKTQRLIIGINHALDFSLKIEAALKEAAAGE